MKKLIFLDSRNSLLFFFLFCFLCQSNIVVSQQQSDSVFYLFKKDWVDTKKLEKAAYFMHVVKENDTAYICRYYHINGPMIRQEAYMNPQLTLPNGRFCWYDANGNLDSTGLVRKRNKVGTWNYYDDNLQPVVSIRYDAGYFTEKIEHPAAGVNSDETNSLDSSLEQAQTFSADELNTYRQWQSFLEENITIPERFLNVLDRKNYEVTGSFYLRKQENNEDIFLMRSCEWSADAEVITGIRKSITQFFAARNDDSINRRIIQSVEFQTFYSPEDSWNNELSANATGKIIVRIPEVPAMFPGGVERWQQYLEKHMNSSVALDNNAPVGNYTVVVSFLVNEQGIISEVEAISDPGYGTAEEAVRAIKNGPSWIPAIQNGKKVIYRQKQSMTFSVYETTTTTVVNLP